MSVLEMCDPEAAAVSVEASVADAVRLMLDRHVGSQLSIARAAWPASSPNGMCCAKWR